MKKTVWLTKKTENAVKAVFIGNPTTIRRILEELEDWVIEE